MRKEDYRLIKIELLSETNFCLESLDLYSRKQNVNKVYRRIGMCQVNVGSKFQIRHNG